LPKVVNRVGREFNDFCIIVGEPQIGAETWVGYFTLLDGSGGLKIGRHCCISSGVQIYTHDTVRWTIENLRKDHVNYSHVDRAPVKIGENVYVGANAVILKGVTIGDQCVIGAGAVVTRSLPPRSVAVGVPARIAGHVEVRKGASKIVMKAREI
jgi:acetyltransferase-like isoleucine patch superfamily enzyme